MLETLLQSIEEHLLDYFYVIIAIVVLATLLPCAFAVAAAKEKDE